MAEAPTKFPEVQGGGSLIIAWQIRGKKVLVVGGGEVSSPENICVRLHAVQCSIVWLTWPKSRLPRAASSTVSMPTPT
jgi:hypothetical protein